MAQIVPVFLLVFAVRDGWLVRSMREEKLPRRLPGCQHLISRLRSNRAVWPLLVLYFLGMEVWYVVASDGRSSVPVPAGYGALVVLMLYVWLELSAHVLPDGESN